MLQAIQLKGDHVRKNTSEKVNAKIDRQTSENISRYTDADKSVIRQRLKELDKEWDIERALEMATATNTLIGLTLGLTVNKKWFALTAITASFLIQHTMQGWCPPIPVLRRFGIRTQREIELERDALEAQL